MRNRYLARSLPGSVPHERFWARRAARTALSASAGVALRDERERLLRRRIDRGERAAVRSRDVAAADEQAVTRLDRDDVARFGRWRVLPRDRLAVAEPPARRRAVTRRDEARFRVGRHARHYGTRSGSGPRAPTIRYAIRVRSGALLAGFLVAGCGARSTPPPSAAGTGSWTTIPAVAPVPLLEVAVAERAGRIWVAGGLRTDGTASDEVFILDPAAGTWTSGPKLPEAVHHASMVSTPAGLVLFGRVRRRRPDRGDSRGPPARRTARLPGPTRRRSPTRAPRARPPSTAHASCTPAGSSPVASRTRSSPGRAQVRGRWSGDCRSRASTSPPTSDGAGRTFVLGGRVGGLDRNLAVVDLVDGATTKSIGELPTKRGGVAAFWWPSLGACLAGGESPGGANPQVECITADGTLARLPDLGVARHGIGAAVVDGHGLRRAGRSNAGPGDERHHRDAGAALSLSSGTRRSGTTSRSSGRAGGRRGRRTSASGPRG